MASLYSLGGATLGDDNSVAMNPYSFGDADLGTATGVPLGTYSPSDAYAAGNSSSWWTQLGSLTSGYLSRRVDVDIASRMATAGVVNIAGDQRTIYSTPKTGLQLTTTTGQSNSLGNLLVLGLIVLVVVKVL